MFGKRTAGTPKPQADAAPKVEAKPAAPAPKPAAVAEKRKPEPKPARPTAQEAARAAASAEPSQKRSDNYYETKAQVFSALIDAIDLSHLAKMEPAQAREEIRDIVNDIMAIKNVAMSISEQ